MKVTQQQAREFLESINEKDKVAIFTHKDLDGFAAGILLKDFCERKGCETKTFIIDYGVNKISDYNIDKFNIILLSDLGPSSVTEDLEKLNDKKIFYTDHHPEDPNYQLPEKVLTLATASQGYIPSTKTIYELTEKENKDKFWLALLGILSDSADNYPENKEYLENSYKKINLTQEQTKELLYKLNFVIVGAPSFEKGFEEISKLKKIKDITKLKEIYEPVEKEWTRLEKDYLDNKKEYENIIYYYFDTNYSKIKTAFVTAMSRTNPEKAFIFATIKKGNLISISGRNQSRNYDVSKILKDCLEGLKDSLTAGHKAAAGGQVDKSDLETFKQNLKNYNVENAKI